MDVDKIRRVVPGITRNLRQFGYPDLTEADTRAQVEKIIAGDQDLDIIGMFAKGMLEDNGLLPEEGGTR